MLKSLRVFALTVALMIVASASALAYSQDFVLVNNTGSTIFNVYCSSVNSGEWEEDILGDTGTISPGEAATIRFDAAERGRYWDLRIIFDNGADYVFTNVDLFSISRITVNSDATATYE